MLNLLLILRMNENVFNFCLAMLELVGAKKIHNMLNIWLSFYSSQTVRPNELDCSLQLLQT